GNDPQPRSTMVRAADLELEFNQYRENMNSRLTTLENELAAMRFEANQHHEQSNQCFHSYDDLGFEIFETSAAGEKKNPKEGVNSLGSKRVMFGTTSTLTAGTNFKANDYRFKKLNMPIFDGEDAYREITVLFMGMIEKADETAWVYVALFKELAGQLVGVSEQVLEATFIKGLKLDLRASVRVMHPEGLNHAMILAGSIEDNKGFNNGARGGEEYEEEGREELKMATDHAYLDMVKVSLNFEMGFTPNHTMKLRGKIGDQEVAVLIDCGATHNFVKNRRRAKTCKQIEYLGHVVTRDEVEADPSKVKAMLEWPVPKSIRELRSFLRLTGYYRPFVKGHGYDFEIQYRPEIENRVADALSRWGEYPKLAALSIPWVIDWQEMVHEISRDPQLSTIRGRLVIRRYSPWILKLFCEFHNSVVGGHFEALKTQRRMAKEEKNSKAMIKELGDKEKRKAKMTLGLYSHNKHTSWTSHRRNTKSKPQRPSILL
nr:putative reverse transcriptase [Tanacetum cinerariifolium]